MAEGQKPDVKAIELDLKKMLNMHPGNAAEKTRDTNTSGMKSKGVVFTMDDLKEVAGGKDHKKKHHKNKEKKHHLDDHQLNDSHKPVTHRPRHQEDPPTTPGQAVDDENHLAKKKKKPRKKKKKNESELQNNGKKKKNGVSNSDESDQDRPLPKKFNLDFLRMKYLDDKLTPATMHELEKERIFPLKKKSPKFPHAKYFCRLCDYHCDNIPVSRQHANDARHRRRKEISIQDKMLKNLPYPSERHLAALDEMVESICTQHGLTAEDLTYRHTVSGEVEKFIIQTIPDIKLHLFGSSLTGFGLKDADVNMDLVYPAGSNPATYLANVYKLLAQSDEYHNVRSDFQAKVPSVLFQSPCKTLRCQICVGSEQAYMTSRYLAIYRKLDDRCRKLAIVFKHWARVCEVDKQESGSLPAYTLALMTVFYLQQCKTPVLPVLWKDLSEKALKRPKLKSDEEQMLGELEQSSWTSNNDMSLGSLWRDLMLFYGVNFDLSETIICVRSESLVSRAEKKWKSKRVAIEDPFSPKRNVARSMYNTRVFDYFYNCLRKACLYFSLPTSHQNLALYYKNKRQTSNKQKENELQSLEGKSSSKMAENQTGIKEKQEIGEVTEVKHESQSKKLTSSETGSETNQEIGDKTETQSRNLTKYDESSIQMPSTTDAENKAEQKLNVSENLKDVSENSIVESTETNDQKEALIEDSIESSETDDNSNVQGKLLDELTNSTEINTGSSSDVSIPENKFLEDCRQGNIEVIESSSEVEDISGVKDKVDSDNEESSEVSDTINSFEKLKINNEEMCSKEAAENEKLDRDCEEDCDTVDTNFKANSDIIEKDSHEKEITEEIKANGDLIGAATKSCVKNDRNIGETVNDELEEKSSRVTIGIHEEKKDSKSTGQDIPKPVSVKTKALGTNKRDSESDKKISGNEMDDESDFDSSLESESESELELESPDSSPIMNRRKLVSSPVGAEYIFEFNTETLTDGKGPSVYCPICEKEGHLKMDCPEDKIPEIVELPPITKQHIQILTQVVKQVLKDFRLTPQEISERDSVRRNLELHIQDTFPDAELRLFGSSMNGFGFHISDLDICVTFRGKKAEEVNFVEHIEVICQKLKQHRGLYGVFPITSAKVPIVKFKHRNSNLEGDMSMYNILAMENTRLLYTYACVDPRVQTLGYAIKVFAKVCDIGDASKGSLSSYAYMLMMLHYLQQTKPPLIPVLQEIKYPEEDEKRVNIVEGCNAWFFDQLNYLSTFCPDHGKNNQSVGDLWLGFFRYYLEDFNFLEQVITIRQFEPLTKFEKLWNGKCIAIEDPFDLGHNLGSGLSRRMNQYILCTLVHARELYGKPVQEKPDGYQSIQDYFFDKSLLVDGDPPSDRLCRVCGKIGHIAKECPVVLARKERGAVEKKRREDQRKMEEEQGLDSPCREIKGRGQDGRHDGTPYRKERPGTSRSLSDPGNNPPQSPRGRGGQFFHRTNNSQSPDKRIPTPLLSIPVPGKYQQANFGPASPVSPRDHYNQRWGSPGQSEQAYYRQGQNNNQSNQSYHRSGSQNENSSNRRYQNQNRNQNRSGSGPVYSMNQNYDHRQGEGVYSNQQHRGYSQGGSRNYPSSPSSNSQQQQQGFYQRNQYYEGSQQGGHRERLVNLPKNRRGQATDLGVTVKNEFYEGKEG